MTQAIFIIAALFTILGGGGIIGIIIWIWKNKEQIKNTLAEWTRRGIKVIYVWVSHDDEETVSLNFYLCGEEKSWLFSDFSCENGNSYILAIKTVHYTPLYDSYSDRNDSMSEWVSQIVRPLSEGPFPVLVQLVGESGFRFGFYRDNDETITFSDSFKFKAELTELRKKYRIKYLKKAPKAIDRWKIENKYPT